ncbi:MAG TPA: hypothetical protein VMI56_12620 [Reyranella sp.]|nr:hypothetical protein [Reyranella sp.]
MTHTDTSERLSPETALHARYGFMERPHIPRLLEKAKADGCSLDLDEVVFYVGHNRVLRAETGSTLPAWQQSLFTVMERNAAHVSDVLALPGDPVVEIGRQIRI